jgi:hypothetical protein
VPRRLDSIRAALYLAPTMSLRPRVLPAGFVAPCLPTSAPQPPCGALWLHEIKHDGFRVIARKNGQQVKLYSRPGAPRSENSKANRIEIMKGPAEYGQICSVGRRKIAKKIAKNKRCYANTLRPCSRMLLKGDEGGLGGHYPLGHLRGGHYPLGQSQRYG